MSEWISVKDWLPGDYAVVLVYAGTGLFFAHYQVVDGGTDGKAADCWYEATPADDWELTGVTHWMRLPDPPRG